MAKRTQVSHCYSVTEQCNHLCSSWKRDINFTGLLRSMTRSALLVTHEQEAEIFQKAFQIYKPNFRITLFVSFCFNAYSKYLLGSLTYISLYHQIQECMASIHTVSPTEQSEVSPPNFDQASFQKPHGERRWRGEGRGGQGGGFTMSNLLMIQL